LPGVDAGLRPTVASEAKRIDCHEGIAQELPNTEGVDPGWTWRLNCRVNNFPNQHQSISLSNGSPLQTLFRCTSEFAELTCRNELRLLCRRIVSQPPKLRIYRGSSVGPLLIGGPDAPEVASVLWGVSTGSLRLSYRHATRIFRKLKSSAREIAAFGRLTH
jgi:hypothetical protein